MIFAHVMFYLFSVLALIFALWMIFSANAVHSALSLVAVFFCIAAVWIILQAEFLGIILVLVYVGAVMTLFLFVLMMLNVKIESRRGRLVRYLPLALLLSIALFLLILFPVLPVHFGLAHYPMPTLGSSVSNVAALGLVLYTDYLYAFELAGVILLIGMVAAIALAHRGPRARKNQLPGKQVKAHKADRLRIIKMKSEGSHD